jgi:hypothetical protein
MMINGTYYMDISRIPTPQLYKDESTDLRMQIERTNIEMGSNYIYFQTILQIWNE